MIKVSIIVPYLREETLKRCIFSIYENAGIPKEEYEIISEEDTERIGCAKMVKKLVYKANSDKVLFIGEDVIAEKDFLKEALIALETFEDGIGLAALNDRENVEPTEDRNCKLASHWIASKELLLLLDGEFFHTGYDHCYCDNELTNRCIALGKYMFAEKSLITHKPVRDVFHVEKRKASSVKYDRALYKFRKEHGWKTPISWDGERCVPNHMHKNIKTYMEHIARYNYAMRYVRDRKVLDASCGSGYGTNMFYDIAKEVYGVDINPAALSYAKKNYRGKFGFCDLNKDFPDEIFDSVVSFETIEHLKHPETFLENVKNHSKEFMFSIPIELQLTNNHNQFHLHKYSIETAKELIENVFDKKKVRYWIQAGINFYNKYEDPRYLIGYLDQGKEWKKP